MQRVAHVRVRRRLEPVERVGPVEAEREHLERDARERTALHLSSRALRHRSRPLLLRVQARARAGALAARPPRALARGRAADALHSQRLQRQHAATARLLRTRTRTRQRPARRHTHANTGSQEYTSTGVHKHCALCMN